ncbi:ABC transporter substrate-binding protein [Tuberibacillus sp. Marseille-P3662]|uniref:ABC transporter substrate-binding protein n=1 Tax=Tuberibacillus sp. Marseille-P3662 TaxID=1965358 RepID=UPI000A1CEC7E|nr:ABC transporter substrate-binding protein [Tuberibacillus sp. Marseille-P3662]
MRRLSIASLVALMTLSLVLMGCSSSTSDNNSEDQSQDTGQDNGSNVLVFGRGADSQSLDPAVPTDGESFKVTKNIYDTLIEYDGQTTDITKGLATDWKISNGGKTYTLTLREGVKFHDNTDFNAEAVVFNFERWKEGDFAYYASMFGAGDDSIIKNVKAVDDYKVKFELKKPQAPFLKNLAMSPFAIASPTAVKKYGDQYGKEAAVGTGPFKFEEWKAKDTITLVKNDSYWREGQPKLDRVVFKVIPNNSSRLNAVKSGEIDLMDGVNPSDIKEVNGNENLEAFYRPPMNVGYLGFNTQAEGPMSDPKVRRALSHAVDKQALIDAFYAGKAKPAKNPMPSSIAGYNDSIQDYEFDLDKAKKLLAEAGYPDGFKTEFWTMANPRPYMPQPKKIAEAIANNLKQIGVETEIQSMEWATYLEKVEKGEAPMFLLGWTGDNGDPDNFLYTLLHKDTIGSNNYARYDNAEVNELLKKAQKLTDEQERNKLYKQAQEIIHKDAPWIPVAHSTPALVGKKTIEGFKPHPTGSDKLNTVYFKK